MFRRDFLKSLAVISAIIAINPLNLIPKTKSIPKPPYKFANLEIPQGKYYYGIDHGKDMTCVVRMFILASDGVVEFKDCTYVWNET